MASGAAFWDRIAERYARKPVGDVPAYEHTLERARAHLSPNDRVLEVGCGTGTTALKLAPAVGTLLASDLSERMIAIARAKPEAAANPNVTFVRADLFDPRLDGTYDAVLAFSLLHLLDDLPAGLARIHGLLAPGGRLISKTVCLADFGRIWRVVVPAMRLVGLAPRVDFLGVAALDRRIEEGGFTILETGVFPQSPPARFVVARKAAG